MQSSREVSIYGPDDPFYCNFSARYDIQNQQIRQGYKGIRQWTINLCTLSNYDTQKYTPSVDSNYFLKKYGHCIVLKFNSLEMNFIIWIQNVYTF